MNVNDLLLGNVMSATQGLVQSGALSTPLMWIRTELAQGSGASVTVTATLLTFTTDGTTVDDTVGVSGVIDTNAAAYNTMGEVQDAINASANWSCVLLGTFRAAASDNSITAKSEVDLSTAAYKASGLYLFSDGTAADYHAGFGISGFNPNGYVKGTEPDENCFSVCTFIDVLVNSSAASTVAVYSASQTGETLVWSDSLTDNTQTPFGNHVSTLFQSKLGERLIVLGVNDQSTADDNITVSGKTVNVTGEYVNGYPLTNA